MLRDHGALDRARRVLEEALAVRRDTRGREAIADLLRQLAMISQTEGDTDAARRQLRQGLDHAVDFGDVPSIIECIDTAASLLAPDRLEKAAQLARAADEARERLGIPALPRERVRREQLRRSIADVVDLAHLSAPSMTIAEAVEAARAALSA
jgi:hypothetical protein